MAVTTTIIEIRPGDTATADISDQGNRVRCRVQLDTAPGHTVQISGFLPDVRKVLDDALQDIAWKHSEHLAAGRGQIEIGQVAS